ncbi:50S ribosomal protein L21 [bacterium]|nr:50S ribosomal protein L21 [bacterium]
MYAVIKTGGKQYRVSEGDEIFVEKLEVEDGKDVTFNEVLMVNGKVGTPYLDGASVTGTVLKHGKGKKIRIFKYKNKSRSNRKTQGHRQPYTKIKITKING